MAGYIVNTDKLADVVGKTRQHVNSLARDGILPKVADGKWDLADAAKAYIAYMENGRTEGNGDAERKKLDAEVRLKEAKAKVAELELQELEGEMHRSEDVADMTENLVCTIRGAMTALPGRLAAELAPLSKPAEISEVIRREVNQALLNLSNYQYDPEKYRERVRERAGWKGNKAGEDDE